MLRTDVQLGVESGARLTPAVPSPCREERHGWPADPVWAESNWPADTPHLEFFLREAGGTDAAVLAAGLAVTCVSAALALALNLAHARRKKRQ